MLQKILILVVLSIGAVVSIVDPKYFEKSQPYRRDPYIAQELQRHQHRHTSSYRADYQPRLSPERYQQSENVEQQERHANYGRPGHDYANNIDEHYGGCPSGFTGQLPYPYDCRRFVNCWKGRAYIQTCGPGTVFNADTQECDHPTKVVCQGLSALSRRNAESTTHRLARVQTSASDEVSCPPGHTGLVAHPQDCSKFLNCANGVMHIQSCGPQTMFDPHMKVCNFEHQVDCSGRDGGSYSSPSPLPAPVSGYRGGKTFESNARDNQAVNQEVPQRKGWPHSHNHHGFQSGYPSRSPPPSGSFSHDEENCTEVNYNHRQMPSAQPAAQTPIIYRDRWATMNRTRPSPPAVPGRTWTTTTTTTTQKPSRWWPIPQTTSTPQPTWQSHGSSGSSWTTPRPSSPEPSRPQSGRGFIHLLPPPQDPIPVPTSTTIPPPGVNTNVRTFQIYPPATIQNATTRLHASPFYSSPYAGVAHSRNAAWSSTGFDRTSPSGATPSPRHSTTTFVPEDNFEPEIIFSHDGGVVLPNRVISTTTERHGVSPPSYNREFYKQTTPFSVYNAPAETDTSDEVGQLPISEAIRLLLRPYFNRSGTMTDDMATNAESHIMSLSRSKEPTRTTSLRTTTTTSTATTTSTVAPPEIHKDVEIVFAGEQNSLTPGNTHPFHSHVHNHHQHHQHPPSKFHQHHHHDSDFHRRHPHLPNPFENELGEEDDSEHELTTPRAWEELKTTTEVVRNPAVDDVCQFDCGNGKCVKTFETCDGINNCGNRRDEEQCDHLGYDIRLSNENGGRVEVKILGQWGYVCDDKFGIQDANVVCRELGFPLGASEVRGNSYYPPTDGEGVSFVMDEVDCSGNETSLKDCPFMGWGVSDCGPDEVVGVQCKTPVMKCPNDYWLCSTSKECIPPAFVCDNVADCSDKSDESSAVCNSTVEFRLKGGKSKQEGRLEVLYRGAWGTVCDDDFGQTEAQVACNSLGYYGTAKIIKNAFGPGSGPIWLDQVSCFGNESTIDTCNHWSWGEHNCNHTEDVSLKCTAGSPPRQTNTGIKGEHKSTEEVQATTLDDIGMDIYPMERSSKFANTRKLCGHFNPNLTEELPREFERVVRGNLAKRGHHPWQATIRSKGRGGISSHWCGAVLISKKHLLTAAHCLVGYAKGAYFIRLGDHYANIAESSEIDSYIENWYIHEKFRDGTHMNNDIAVIVMKNPVRFNDYIQPICLPREGTEYEEGRQCTISGWGSIQSGLSTPSNNLRVAEIPIISDEVCKLPHVYGNSITEGMFCAGFLEEGVDACEGDSGGPFVCSDSGTETLYGIISWGQQCGYANKPGVYVKIEKYLDWIYEKIRFSMQQTN